MSHVLIPQINKIDAVHTLEGSNGNGNGKEPSPTMQIAVKGLRLFDTLASIFSTIWLIVGKHFCLPRSKINLSGLISKSNPFVKLLVIDAQLMSGSCHFDGASNDEVSVEF